MNRSLLDMGESSCWSVSLPFTEMLKGRRPGFSEAACPKRLCPINTALIIFKIRVSGGYWGIWS